MSKMILNIGIALAVIWIAFMIFTWTLGGLGRGRKFGNKIASHLGMSNNFFHSVLDNGVKGPSLQLLAMLEGSDLTLQQASVELGPSLERGLIALENRFGRQEVIDNSKAVVARLVREWEELQLQRNSS